jgi:hypothetical protein
MEPSDLIYFFNALQVYSPNYVLPPTKCCSAEMDMDLRYYSYDSLCFDKIVKNQLYYVVFSPNFSIAIRLLILQFLDIL